MKLEKVYINHEQFLDLVHWARRYADMRKTGVPGAFNGIYDNIRISNPGLLEKEQSDAHVCEGFPHARDGLGEVVENELRAKTENYENR